MRGSLNWGPFTWLNGVSKTYGWWSQRRQSYASSFHTYSVEWTEKFILIYFDTWLHHMLTVSFDEPFFERGEFPPLVANGSQTVQTPNLWANATGQDRNAAPFNKPFYLMMNVPVGGYECVVPGWGGR